MALVEMFYTLQFVLLWHFVFLESLLLELLVRTKVGSVDWGLNLLHVISHMLVDFTQSDVIH